MKLTARILRAALLLTPMPFAAAHAQPPAQAPAQAPCDANSAAALAFRAAVSAPPPGFQGPVFELSHAYPERDPGACPKEVCRWLAYDEVSFNNDPTDPRPRWNAAWARYMQLILDYVREGQDPDLRDEIGWRADVADETRWFHVPWMAYDPTFGREFIHGLTNERTALLRDLGGGPLVIQKGAHTLSGARDDTQKAFETWAFGVYNPWGGYAIGKTWQPDGAPRTVPLAGQNVPRGLPFSAGTLVAKLLFTTATADDVAYLAGSAVWRADRHVEQDGAYRRCRRAVQPVRLVQLDVAVVDPRSPSRWVFGTFAYNGTKRGATVWDRLSPLGLQWGTDPWTFPAVPKGSSVAPVQSVLDEHVGIPEHFGCNGRLAGPVDNRQSSCMSCHGGAHAPPPGSAATPANTPPIFGFPGMCTSHSVDNANYFNNSQFPQAYSGGQYPGLIPLDTSLQMQVAFFQYGQFAERGRPQACTD